MTPHFVAYDSTLLSSDRQQLVHSSKFLGLHSEPKLMGAVDGLSLAQEDQHLWLLCSTTGDRRLSLKCTAHNVLGMTSLSLFCPSSTLGARCMVSHSPLHSGMAMRRGCQAPLWDQRTGAFPFFFQSKLFGQI